MTGIGERKLQTKARYREEVTKLVHVASSVVNGLLFYKIVTYIM